MKRNYRVEDFIQISKTFRSKFKRQRFGYRHYCRSSLGNRTIIQKTLKIINQIKPDIVHIFKFSKRKNTPDYALKDWPDRIKKQRSRELTKLFQDISREKNQRMKGKIFQALVIEKRGLARTNSGRAVVLDKGKPGSLVKAK